jgi:hypothetical protein
VERGYSVDWFCHRLTLPQDAADYRRLLVVFEAVIDGALLYVPLMQGDAGGRRPDRLVEIEAAGFLGAGASTV